MKKEKNYLDPQSNNSRINNVINKAFVLSNTNTPKNYELFNAVSETGDSIYTPSITYGSSPSEVKQEVQFYIHVDILEKLSDQIKSIQKGLALLRKDLIKSGLLKEV